MNWKEIERVDDGFSGKKKSMKVPRQWVYEHYYEIFNLLFRIENALRILVYIVLKEKFQGGWDDIQITSDDNQQGTISSIAKRRMNQDEDFGYLGYSVTCPIMYLTSGELIGIIISDSYWEHFNDYFNCKRKLVKTKLDEISNVRNALAHFRPLKKEDVELVKQNASHILNSVEDGLMNIFKINDIVPTNTEEEWYSSLNNLESEYCDLSFKQSPNKEWIKININYCCPIINNKKNFIGN
ncbi:hypothetical protein [Halanaerobacter jeridensis]|uniref:Swt1-like HEPN domain-containing protein n=1 Tax=Halanaerobacter jeridensis TaxID=706427 RepID=A0A938XVD3_9FIRM|nr:hypothetical protein [Halanaerobacter jeridensis]MBM7558228.1 hypothetical protein [Halanaerobacter jeridensis]